MNAITVPKNETELVEQIDKANVLSIELLRQVEEVTIDSVDMYELADVSLSELHAAEKAFTTARANYLGPATAELKRRRELVAPAEERLEIAKRTLRRKMGIFQDTVRIHRERAEREAEEAMRKQRDEAAANIAAAEEIFAAAPGEATSAALEDAHAAAEIADVTIVQPRTIATPGHTASSKSEEWNVDLPTNHKDLAKLLRFIADDLEKDVPRFDNTVDIKISQLKNYAKATKGTLQIPGCTIRRGTKIIAR